MQFGIKMHRSLDRFTDQHADVRKSISMLWDPHRHYSAVIIDVFYDYVLSNEFSHYSSQSLDSFVTDINRSLFESGVELPAFIDHRITNVKWLANYRNIDGLEAAFTRLNKRSRKDIDLTVAIEPLIADYSAHCENFTRFFADIQIEAQSILKNA